jgi:repressor of nif and glnA expression
MVDEETTERIVEVLEAADEPLTAGRIQRQLATESRDVTTGVIRDACKGLEEAGRAEKTDELPPAYRLAE